MLLWPHGDSLSLSLSLSLFVWFGLPTTHLLKHAQVMIVFAHVDIPLGLKVRSPQLIRPYTYVLTFGVTREAGMGASGHL
jgi:hypothetical protein